MLKAISDLNKIRSVEAVVDGLLMASLHFVGMQAASQEVYSLATILFVMSGALATKISTNERIFGFLMKNARAFLVIEFAFYCLMTGAAIVFKDATMRWIILGVVFSITFGVRRTMWEKVKEMAKNGRLLEAENTYSYQTGLVVGLSVSFIAGFFLGVRIDITSSVLLDTLTTGLSSYGFWCVIKAAKALD